MALNFLSRLCGGQRLDGPYPLTIDFLSRLCGGQLTFKLLKCAVLFLSRLCGGQLFQLDVTLDVFFF